MTETEIMKALECWASEKECEETCECFKYDTPRCDLLTARNALDLINRKNAEIERLEADKYLYTEDGKIELLPRTDLDQIRAEAIKEVFDKLEERLCVHTFTSNSTEYADGQFDCMEWVDGKIDELKKEMGVEL